MEGRGGADTVELLASDSDAFFTDQEEGTRDRPSGKECMPLEGGACRSADTSQDLISLEEGELREGTGSEVVQLPCVAARWGNQEDPVIQEIHRDVLLWRYQWACRPGIRAPVTLIVDRYGQNFDHRDRLMFVQKVDQSNFGQLADMVQTGALDVKFEKVVFMVGWNRDVGLSKSRVITSIKRLVKTVEERRPGVILGFSGLVPNYWKEDPEVIMKAVNFNRNMSTGAKELWRAGHFVQFLPLHLHFQVRDDVSSRGMFLQSDGTLTKVAAFCLRGILMEEFGLDVTPR